MRELFADLRVLHPHRRIAIATNLAAVALFVGVACLAGSVDWVALVVLVFLMAVSAVVRRPESPAVQMFLGGVLWLMAGTSATAPWCLPAGALLFVAFVASHLASWGPDRASIGHDRTILWARRTAIVLVISTLLSGFGLAVRAAKVHGSLLVASLTLIVIAVLMLASNRLVDRLSR